MKIEIISDHEIEELHVVFKKGTTSTDNIKSKLTTEDNIINMAESFSPIIKTTSSTATSDVTIEIPSVSDREPGIDDDFKSTSF